jgi:hypothetical protein
VKNHPHDARSLLDSTRSAPHPLRRGRPVVSLAAGAVALGETRLLGDLPHRAGVPLESLPGVDTEYSDVELPNFVCC